MVTTTLMRMVSVLHSITASPQKGHLVKYLRIVGGEESDSPALFTSSAWQALSKSLKRRVDVEEVQHRLMEELLSRTMNLQILVLSVWFVSFRLSKTSEEEDKCQ